MAKIKINARIDPVFMEFRGKHETQTEFIERAFKALREKELSGGNNGLEHGILVKMCKIFINKKIKMNLSMEEMEFLDKFIRTEVLGNGKKNGET